MQILHQDLNAYNNSEADFTIFRSISPSPVLKVCVIIWYWDTTIVKEVQDNNAEVIELSAVLSRLVVSAGMKQEVKTQSSPVAVLPASK